ncbi:hypothetical protein CNMCM8927_005023 [Aspergillus lentulus]|uniref:NAD-dependent epimerase/dehydratase domain-containing protein n=1 Tax=Aspergillus lentulus TaxID=293939 RepID=A0AAN5YX07_ASPLE|nr:hypothetical protein CNMCM7927_005133 [Aspergillus lentulus]KAF4209820.1 hypothetical protein CNMCM8927_005023 [Aspergillus lentulus]
MGVRSLRAIRKAKDTFALKSDSRVLVTGANGYIASHVANELLKLGYRVKGTVREPKPWLDKMFNDRYGQNRYTSAVLHSYDNVGKICDILEGVEAIIHLSGNIVVTDNPGVILPSVKLVTNVLEAAATKPSITRVVLASSSMAAYTPIPDKEGVIITADTWNDHAVREAWNALPAQLSTTIDSQWKKRLAIYSACKTEMERQAWNWITKNKPSFEFNAVLAAFTVGKIIHRQIGGSTMGWVRGLLKGEKQPLLLVPPKWFVDVEDVARLFAIAACDSTVRGQRLFAFAESHNWTDIIQILRACQPSHPLILEPPAEEGRDLAKILPRGRALELLRKWYGQRHWTPIALSIKRGLESQ